MDTISDALRSAPRLARAPTGVFLDLRKPTSLDQQLLPSDTAEDVMERRLGRFLFVDRNHLIGLTVAIFVITIISIVPALLMTTYAVGTLAGLLFFQGILVGRCSDVMNGRNWSNVRSARTRRVYLFMTYSADVVSGLSAVLAALFALYAITSASLGLAGCARRNTTTSLGEFIFAEPGVCNTTDLKALNRRPGFAGQLIWYQTCLDDMLVTIMFIVLCGVLVALDVGMAVLMFRVRYVSESIYHEIMEVLAAAKTGKTIY